MGICKQYILNCDIRFGQHLSLCHIAYTQEAILTDGQGAYSRDEWTKARKAGYNQAGADARELDSESSFLRRALGTERRKLLTGLRLADYLRRTGRQTMLEVGCGEMITAWSIKTCLPELRYLATDFDDFIVEKCGRLPLLQTVEKQSLDIDAVTVGQLREFEVVAGWDVFYSFDEVRLSRFLAKLGEAGCTLVICSSQTIGPLRALSYLIKSRLSDYAGRARTGRLRAHGFKCSVGYYQRLAATAGLACRLLEPPPLQSLAGDTYTFIEIAPRNPRPARPAAVART